MVVQRWDSEDQERAMFERFTDRGRQVVVLAHEEARRLEHDFVGTEHILLGLLQEGEGVAGKALESLGISLEAVRTKVMEISGPPGSSTTESPPFTPRAKKVLDLALREALQLGQNFIGTEHMLLGIVREGQGLAAQVLVSMGTDLTRVRQQVIQLLSGYAPSGDPKRLLPRPSSIAFRRPTLVDPGAGVSSAPVPVDPTILVTWEDVEEVLRTVAALGEAAVVAWEASGIAHRSCDYIPKPLPSVTISVAGAEVSREAFERTTANRHHALIAGLGDAATFEVSTGSLRVLKGSVAFSIIVRDHPNPRAAAIALARKAGERLERAT